MLLFRILLQKSEATIFAYCPSLETVVMPASILMSKMGATIFLESPNVTAIVKENSGAYSYCVNNKVKYRVVKNNIENESNRYGNA